MLKVRPAGPACHTGERSCFYRRARRRRLTRRRRLSGARRRRCPATPARPRRPLHPRTPARARTVDADLTDAILDRSGPVRGRSDRAAQPAATRRAAPPSRWLGHHAGGLPRSLPPVPRVGLGHARAARRDGGQGMPHVLATVVEEFLISACHAFTMYPGLTYGAVAALIDRGRDELKAGYLPKLVSGEWLGTMKLTEPHAGTDLGLIRTKAEPHGDGSFAITGEKIFMLGRRARPDREHHPPRPRQAARCARGLEGHLAVPGAQGPARRERATRSRAARSSTRWASTAARPA